MMNFFQGRKKDFEKLTWPLSQDLYRLAYWRLGNQQDAEDVLQNTYLRAYRSFGTFKPGTNIRAWLTKILMNVVSDTIKNRVRQADSTASGFEPEDLDMLESNCASLRDPQVQLSEQEIDPELLAALRRLPSNLLHPLLLRELEEMTYDEIAACLEIPVGTVMSRLFRARRVLREHLENAARQQKEKATEIRLGVATDEV